MRVKELRLARGWSQAQLAELSGLSVRTIQRIENGTNPGLESLKGLAAVFGVDVGELQAELSGAPRDVSFAEAVRYCLRHFDDFRGVAGKAEFWWFTAAVALAIALGTTIAPWLGSAVAIVLFMPWLAVTTRRLRDADQSLWWLLVGFAPVGGLVVLAVLCSMPSNGHRNGRPVPKPEFGPS